VARYFKDHARLRPLTYAKSSDKFRAWCSANGVRSVDNVTLAQLVAFRSHLAGSPKRGAKPTGKRGPKRETAAPRAASAVNVKIRSIKVVLGYLRRVGLLPKLSRDDLTGGLAGPRGRARRSPVPSASPNRGAPTGSLCPRRRDLQVNARRAARRPPDGGAACPLALPSPPKSRVLLGEHGAGDARVRYHRFEPHFINDRSCGAGWAAGS